MGPTGERFLHHAQAFSAARGDGGGAAAAAKEAEAAVVGRVREDRRAGGRVTLARIWQRTPATRSPQPPSRGVWGKMHCCSGLNELFLRREHFLYIYYFIHNALFYRALRLSSNPFTTSTECSFRENLCLDFHVGIREV